MEATAFRNAEAPVGQPGLGGKLGTRLRRKASIAWPAPRVKPRQKLSYSVELWPHRKLSTWADSAEALADAPLRWWERLALGSFKRRLGRLIGQAMDPPTYSYSSPEVAGGPAAWAAMDAARETIRRLDAAGRVSANDPATRQALGEALETTATAAYLPWEDSAALQAIARGEVTE